MNNPKHTPGPWKTYEHVDAFEGVTLTAVGRGDDTDDVAYVADPANARLIAAAPDMVKVLREVQTIIQERKNIPESIKLEMIFTAVEEALINARGIV